MKLRIKGNSLRFRVTRSELTKLVDTGRIEETTYFSFDEHSKLIYALEHQSTSTSPFLRYRSPELAIILSTQDVKTWAGSEQVGVYASIDLGARGALDLAVEKDFACLDLSDADNLDTFPNPTSGVSC